MQYEKSFEELWDEYLKTLEINKNSDLNLEFKSHLLSLIYLVDEFISKYKHTNSDSDKIIEQAKSIINQRYLMTYSDGQKDENWEDISKRVARALTSSMTLYFSEDDIDLLKAFENSVFNLLKYRIFIFNSPALFSLGAGTPKSFYIKDIDYEDYKFIYDNLDRKNFTSAACFILDIEDSIQGIFKTMSDAGLISKAGGGIGFNIGELRPRYAHIKSSDSDSSGSIEFLKMYDAMGKVIKQGSKRRFAGMSVMLDSFNKFWEHEAVLHADAIEFINAKKHNTGDSILSTFNLSVGINNTKDLYNKFVNNEDINFTYKGINYDKVVDPKISKDRYKTSINAVEFMDLISNNAWKTGDPALIFFDKINKYNPYRDNIPMKSTNPCFGKNEKILTDKGYQKIGDLVGQTVNVWSPIDRDYVKAQIFFTGVKDTIDLVLSNGTTMTITPDHELYSSNIKWIKAGKSVGKRILHPSYYSIKPDTYYNKLFMQYGYIIGEIQAKRNKVGLKDEIKFLFLGNNNKEVILRKALLELSKMGKIDKELKEEDLIIIKSILRGVFSASAKVKHNSIVLETKEENLVNDIQYLLEILGIDFKTEISNNKYILSIFEGESIFKFAENIGFIQRHLNNRLRALIRHKSYKVLKIIKNKKQEVYDFSMERTHVGVVNDLVVHNCGERPGISSSEYGIYDTCDLGHLDVSKFFEKENGQYKFMLNDFINLARFSYYTLDFLHDLMMYPVPEVKKGVLGFRSVGLGFYGLAGSLIKMGLPYDSKKAFAFGYLVMKSLEVASLNESYKVGRYLMPLMFSNDNPDTSLYPAEVWYKPNDVFEDIINSNFDTKLLDNLYNETLGYLERDRKLGYLTRRNINTTTVAPTGTTSLLGQTTELGDMGSGVEPIFSFNYIRRVTTANNEQEYKQFTSPLLEKFVPKEVSEYALNNNGSLEGLSDSYPEFSEYEEIYKTANSVNYLDHLRMQEAVQWCCSSSISKTINMKNDVTPEDVKNVYLYAIQSPVIKGVTIYRDGSLNTQVLSSASKGKKDKENKKQKVIALNITDDIKIHLDNKGKIQPKNRDETYKSITQKFTTDKGNNYLIISFDEKGEPIEIFLENGSEKAEIVGRLASSLLRSGASIEVVLKQLKKINHSYSQAVADNIEKVLNKSRELWDNKDRKDINININKYNPKEFKELEEQGIIEYDSRGFFVETETGKTVCQVCGSVGSIIIQEGCQTCSVCSVSKCS